MGRLSIVLYATICLCYLGDNMETVCQVNLNALSEAEAVKSEQVLREYLLRVCDQVNMEIKGSSAYSLFTLWPFSFRVKKLKKMLNPDDIARETDHSWTFNLTPHIKELLNSATLFFMGSPNAFAGFADPKFLLKDDARATIITNEKLINLYIEDTDKADLANKGVQFDDDYS